MISKTKAFTLTEIAVVVLIIGLLGAIALPKYFIYIQRVNYSEGVQVLKALRDAQINYRYENSTFSNNVDDLDVEIPAMKNFNVATLAVADSDPIATVNEKNGNYSLSIDEDGAVHCAGASCGQLLCTGGAGGDECN